MLYLCKPVNRFCMKYCRVWAGVPCFLLLALIYTNEYVGPLVLHLLSLLNPWLMVECNQRLFCRNYFGRSSFEMAELVPFPLTFGSPSRCTDRLDDSISNPFLHDHSDCQHFLTCRFLKLTGFLVLTLFLMQKLLLEWLHQVFLWKLFLFFINLSCNEDSLDWCS